MWDSSSKFKNSRTRKKSIHARDPHRLSLHIKRTKAEIVLTEGLSMVGTGTSVPARVVLNDMSPKGLYLFASEQLALGQQIQLTLEEPRRFFAHGKVVSCQNIVMDRRVISEHQFPYRVGIEFLFRNDAERQAVLQYCQEILGDFLKEAA